MTKAIEKNSSLPSLPSRLKTPEIDDKKPAVDYWDLPGIKKSTISQGKLSNNLRIFIELLHSHFDLDFLKQYAIPKKFSGGLCHGLTTAAQASATNPSLIMQQILIHFMANLEVGEIKQLVKSGNIIKDNIEFSLEDAIVLFNKLDFLHRPDKHGKKSQKNFFKGISHRPVNKDFIYDNFSNLENILKNALIDNDNLWAIGLRAYKNNKAHYLSIRYKKNQWCLFEPNIDVARWLAFPTITALSKHLIRHNQQINSDFFSSSHVGIVVTELQFVKEYKNSFDMSVDNFLEENKELKYPIKKSIQNYFEDELNQLDLADILAKSGLKKSEYFSHFLQHARKPAALEEKQIQALEKDCISAILSGEKTFIYNILTTMSYTQINKYPSMIINLAFTAAINNQVEVLNVFLRPVILERMLETTTKKEDRAIVQKNLEKVIAHRIDPKFPLHKSNLQIFTTKIGIASIPTPSAIFAKMNAAQKEKYQSILEKMGHKISTPATSPSPASV